MAPVEDDDARHRREEAERRAKRKAARISKSGTSEKDRKRREHAQRILNEQNKQKRAKGAPPAPPSKAQDSSVFESLFAQRAQGFRIDFAFRNAPPRPPVGPCFVGLGLEGELNDSWTRYKPLNAVEVNYSWKLHSEPDLGVPLAPSAMDLSCYQDPTQKQKSKLKSNPRLVEDGEEGIEGPPPMHPDDDALLNWTGPMGDTAAEQLKLRRDRARAAARLALAGKAATPITKDSSLQRTTKSSKKAYSRVLDEGMQSWMKKTTYLTNDYSRRVHAFTSLAQTKEKTAQDLEAKQTKIQEKRSAQAIAKSFDACLPPKGVRQHPTRRNLKPVAEMPLLPNVHHWGHAYTHVVLDNPPKEVGSDTASKELISKLDKAFVTNVERRQANARMSCQLLVPFTEEQENLYRATQLYDLDVVPLKDEDMPHVNFVLWLNPKDGTASYLPISSRVQLSTGRPAPKHASNIVRKEPMSESDKQEVEMRMAEVDADMEQKYGGVRQEMDVEETTEKSTSMPTTSKGDSSDEEEKEADLEDSFGNTTQTIVAEG